jgi:hypothetical protein
LLWLNLAISGGKPMTTDLVMVWLPLDSVQSSPHLAITVT